MSPLSLCLFCGQWYRQPTCEAALCRIEAVVRKASEEKYEIGQQALILSRMAAA